MNLIAVILDLLGACNDPARRFAAGHNVFGRRFGTEVNPHLPPFDFGAA